MYESRGFPGNTKYLKITFQGKNTDQSPSIGKVVLNGPSNRRCQRSIGNGALRQHDLAEQGRSGRNGILYDRRQRSAVFANPQALLLSDSGARQSELKTTAVNHSGSGKSAAGMVSTYQYAPASTAAAPVGMVDSLDNFKQMASRSNLYITKNNPGFFDNDGGRDNALHQEPGISFTIRITIFVPSRCTAASLREFRSKPKVLRID